MSITVLEHIEKRPKKFFKRLRPFYKFELVWSKTFKRWKKQNFAHRIKHLKKLRKLPGEINSIGNIIRCLDKYYPPEGKISYGNKTTVETAVIIWDFYGKRIHSHMVKHFQIGKEAQKIRHTEEEAIKELKARGFVPRADVDLESSKPYIRCISHDADLVYPVQFELNDTYEKFPLISVSGYTGIKPPRNYHKK